MGKENNNLIFRFPKWLNERLRWFDLDRNRIDHTRLHRWGFLPGYSSLALWLPIPLIVFLAYGAPDYLLLRWRGWGLFAVTFVAVIVHVICCRFLRGRRLPQLQWALMVAVAGGVWFYANCLGGRGNRWADPSPYAHYLALVSILALTVAMPASRWLADLLIRKRRPEYRDLFANNLHRTQLFVGGCPPPDEWSRVLRAISLVPLGSAILLAFVPAVFVLLVPRVVGWQVLGVLGVWWGLLGTAYYNERLTSFRKLLHQALLKGWPLVLSIAVIGLAGARLADVSYVTTVLDQPETSGPVTGILVSFFLLFWLHNYWEERAMAEVLLGLLHDESPHPLAISYRRDRLQIHGSGRLIALRKVDQPNRKENFESYQPLEVFQRIADQLEGRAREEKVPQIREELWRAVEKAQYLLEALEQKVRLYYALLLLIPTGITLLGVFLIFQIQQQPGLEVNRAHEPAFYDVEKVLDESSQEEPLLAIAASGGGTRAALYTYSVLRALREQEALDRVFLLSSVSGGSFSVAYFAAHREELLEGEVGGSAWLAFRNATAAPHIKNVLAGSGEWRLFTGTRLGQLLSESFIRELHGGDGHPEDCSVEKEGIRTLGEVWDSKAKQGVGVIFNTSVVGSWEKSEEGDRCVKENSGGLGQKFHWGMRKCATTDRGGSRLVITNLPNATEESFDTASLHTKALAAGWPSDFDYAITRDPAACLAAAASLSANFPPVFSNAAVHFNGSPESRYWVTDGGAVENRGLVSLLLALRAEIQRLGQSQDPESREDEKSEILNLPPIKVLVADASGLSFNYAEDRGVGAKLGAARSLANKLIAELSLDVAELFHEKTGQDLFEVVPLAMPEVLTISGAFGTHWAMPTRIEVQNPDPWNHCGPETVRLLEEELLGLMDVLFGSKEERLALEIKALKKKSPESRKEFWRWFEINGNDPGTALKKAISP